MTIKKQETKIIFCGLPSSGKTTFLGALSYLAANDEVGKELELAGLPTERHFFNELAHQWVCCEPMLRTKVSSSEKIEMTLKKNDQHFLIEMPDLSGETWDELWIEHELDTNIVSFLNETSGIVFFIHVDKLKVPMSICDETSIVQPKISDNTDNIQLEKWKPTEHSTTQSIVVDLLGKIASQLKGVNKKLVVVLSAWDTISDSPSPISFIEKELPLLYQYLDCKFDYEQVDIFGVSAQGGSLDQQAQKDMLLDEDEPSKRIKVTKNGTEYSQDLTQILSCLVDE